MSVAIVAISACLIFLTYSPFYPERQEQKDVLAAFVAFAGVVSLLLGILFRFTIGSEVEQGFVYSREIPLSSILNSSILGAISPAEVVRVEIWELGPQRVLNVWGSHGTWAAFNSVDKPEKFEVAVRWLQEYGISTENH